VQLLNGVNKNKTTKSTFRGENLWKKELILKCSTTALDTKVE